MHINMSSVMWLKAGRLGLKRNCISNGIYEYCGQLHCSSLCQMNSEHQFTVVSFKMFYAKTNFRKCNYTKSTKWFK